jgi:hypothetical protein
MGPILRKLPIRINPTNTMQDDEEQMVFGLILQDARKFDTALTEKVTVMKLAAMLP